MNELMEHLKGYDWGGNRGSLAGIDDLIVAAQGNREALADIEQALLGVSQSDAKVPAKEYVCRKLALIGTGRSVPVLVEMLSDEKLADSALFALQGMPVEAVGDALRAALVGARGNLQVGIVNALGERRDTQAVAALSELENGPDTVLSVAAKSALRKIAAPA